MTRSSLHIARSATDGILVRMARVDADQVGNIEANPRVRVKPRSRRPTGWRSGTAHVVEDDDPGERQRILIRGNPWRRLCLSTSAAMATDPLTVRIDLDPEGPPR
jgi:hypothetical protein